MSKSVEAIRSQDPRCEIWSRHEEWCKFLEISLRISAIRVTSVQGWWLLMDIDDLFHSFLKPPVFSIHICIVKSVLFPSDVDVTLSPVLMKWPCCIVPRTVKLLFCFSKCTNLKTNRCLALYARHCSARVLELCPRGWISLFLRVLLGLKCIGMLSLQKMAACKTELAFGNSLLLCVKISYNRWHWRTHGTNPSAVGGGGSSGGGEAKCQQCAKLI